MSEEIEENRIEILQEKINRLITKVPCIDFEIEIEEDKRLSDKNFKKLTTKIKIEFHETKHWDVVTSDYRIDLDGLEGLIKQNILDSLWRISDHIQKHSDMLRVSKMKDV